VILYRPLIVIVTECAQIPAFDLPAARRAKTVFLEEERRDMLSKLQTFVLSIYPREGAKASEE
jgi:hypothetical protein